MSIGVLPAGREQEPASKQSARLASRSRSKLTVAYVAGMPFSGSTLLDRLMARSEEVFSVCEIHHQKLYHGGGANHRSACICGQAWPCAFWRSVDESFRRRTGQSFLRCPALFDSARNVDQADYTRRSEAIYAAVAEVSGCSIIFDSSKSCSVLRALAASETLDLKPIHLIRNPYGNVLSVMRREGVGLVAAARRYRRRHAKIRRLLAGRNHLTVHYELLCQQPESTLASISRFLGTPEFSDAQRFKTDGYHGIGGNASTHATRKVEPDQLRCQAAGVLDRVLIDLLTAEIRWFHAIPGAGSAQG